MRRRAILALVTAIAICAILASTTFATGIVLYMQDPQAHWPYTHGTVMRKYYYHGNGLNQTFTMAFDDGAAAWTSTNSPLSLKLSSSGSSPIWVNSDYNPSGSLGHTALSVYCNNCATLAWANSYINSYFVNKEGFSYHEITQICTHEEGHALGLPHLNGDYYTLPNVMDKFLSDGDHYYQPTATDVALANWVYPGWPSY